MNVIVQKPINHQHGGTLLGLIIGLVVGLSIAVAVALIITKTPTPFTNKLGMTKSANTNDAPPVQLTDPNKPLYGNSYKEPVKPLLGQSAADEAAFDRVVQDDMKANTNPANNVEIKPAKPTVNLPTKNNADEKAAYYLQVGAFRDVADAENVRAKLALIGVESSTSTKSSEADNLFRVRIGPFDQLDEMNRMRSKLSENSIDVAVIKTPK